MFLYFYDMKMEGFIARRIGDAGQKSFTNTIIRIATAAVALSLAVMIITSALINGFQTEIINKMFGFWGHIHITDTRASQSYEPIPFDRSETFVSSIDSIVALEYLNVTQRRFFSKDEQIRQLTTNGGINHLQVFTHLPGIIRTNDEIEGIILKGVSEDYDWSYLKNHMVDGKLLDVAAEQDQDKIVISEFTANRLGLKVGERFIVYFVIENKQIEKRFEVQGVFRTGLEDIDKRFAIVTLPKVQEVLGWAPNQVGGIEVFVDDVDDSDVIAEYIYLEELPSNLYAKGLRKKFPNIFEWLQLQNINGIVILSLMLVVAIINMITALLILILDRTNMIGVLKSLGAEDGSIRKIFIYYAAKILIKGLIIGNVIGLLFCFLQYRFRFITLNESDYYLSYAPINLIWWVAIGLNVGTILLTTICLIIPTYLITKVDPVKTLRFK